MQTRAPLAALSAMSVGALALVAACADAVPTAPASPAAAVARAAGSVGGVFVSTNAAAGNAVVAFARAADGSLSYVGTVATGGSGIGGTNDPLASQFALTLGRSKRQLFVVNAGSDDVSEFAVEGAALTLLRTVPALGARPVSVATSAQALYILNAGDNTIGGYTIGAHGALTPIAGAPWALGPTAGGAAAIRVSPNGRFLTVTERTSNTIDTYVVNPDGSLSGRATTTDPGVVPFGFDYTPSSQVVVSEAGSGSASSYKQRGNGTLELVSGAVSTTQRAPCWLIVDGAGRFAYTANAGSATISGLAIAPNGALTLLTPNGVTGDVGAGSQPLDLDLSRDSRFLYIFKNGTGTVGAFAVNPDGSLAPLPDTPGLLARSGYMGIAAY